MSNGANGAAADLEAIAVALSTAQEQIAELQAKVSLARGTKRDVRPLAKPEAPEPTLSERVEALLRARVASPDEIAGELGVSLRGVEIALGRASRGTGARLRDVGTAGHPRYVWRPGDEAPIEALASVVAALVRERPFERRELVEITGARDNRIGGALRFIQREMGLRLVNLGTGHRNRYLAMPKTMGDEPDAIVADADD